MNTDYVRGGERGGGGGIWIMDSFRKGEKMERKKTDKREKKEMGRN